MNVNSFLKQVREGHSPSKQEEVELLDALHLAFVQHPQNSYLSSLFTAPMVEWTARQMREDVSCDLLAAVNSAGYQANQREAKTKAERDEARAELAKLKIDYSEQNADLQREQENFEAEQAHAEKQRAEIREQYARAACHDTFASAVEKLAMDAWMDDREIEPVVLKQLLNELYDSIGNTQA